MRVPLPRFVEPGGLVQDRPRAEWATANTHHDYSAVLEAVKNASSTLAVPLRRLPSAREALYTYLACLVPIVAWSVFRVLDNGLPTWSRQMRAWDVVGVIAYVQAFALVESTVVFIPLLFLSMVLPLRWFRDKFVALATGIVYLSAAWFVFAQLNDDALRWWGFRPLLPWVGTYCASVLVLSALIHRSSGVEALINSFVHRVILLASTYLLIALAAVVIVLVRNL